MHKGLGFELFGSIFGMMINELGFEMSLFEGRVEWNVSPWILKIHTETMKLFWRMEPYIFFFFFFFFLTHSAPPPSPFFFFFLTHYAPILITLMLWYDISVHLQLSVYTTYGSWICLVDFLPFFTRETTFVNSTSLHTMPLLGRDLFWKERI